MTKHGLRGHEQLDCHISRRCSSCALRKVRLYPRSERRTLFVPVRAPPRGDGMRPARSIRNFSFHLLSVAHIECLAPQTTSPDTARNRGKTAAVAASIWRVCIESMRLTHRICRVCVYVSQSRKSDADLSHYSVVANKDTPSSTRGRYFKLWSLRRRLCSGIPRSASGQYGGFSRGFAI